MKASALSLALLALTFLQNFATAQNIVGKPLPPLDYQIQSPTRLKQASTVTAYVTVKVLQPCAAVRIVARGDGLFTGLLQQQVFPGPFVAGQSVTLTVPARAMGIGNGCVAVDMAMLDGKGAVICGRSAEIHGLRDNANLWTSTSSPTDLRFKRLAELLNDGAITPAQCRAAESEIVRGPVSIDNKPIAPAKMNAAQAIIQEAFKADLSAPPAPAAQVVGQAPVTLTVKGQVKWTDRNGGLHGLPLATVEIRDEDVVGSDLIVTSTTDAAGNYSATFTFDDGLLQGNPDIFVRVFARSRVADIKPDSAGATTYFKQSPTTNEAADGTTLTINFTTGNVNDDDTVYSLHHALVFIGAYAGDLTGRTPSQIDTRFPTTQHTSLFTGSQLHILRLDRWDWDVIHHEYGHYVMAIHGFQNNPGGDHSFGQNLSQSRGSKDIGTRLAWGEGWPTFFGISGQAVNAASSLGIPNVGDDSYQDTEDGSGGADGKTTSVNLETSNGLGEDNEVSVMAALWDLFDGANDGDDAIAISDRTLFNAFKSSACKTVAQAWEAVAATQTTANKALVGAVLAQAKIAPGLISPADKTSISSAAPPTFTWLANGGGAPNPLNDFRISFYKSDFSSRFFQKELANVTSYTPTDAEWTTIKAGDSVVKWIVEGRNTSSPTTPNGTLGRYWSAARAIGGVKIAFVIDDTGSMGEEIESVKTALQQFIDLVGATLMPGETPPLIQLVTFKDNVTLRLTTSDLAAMRAAVGGLFASGGDDCPEFGAQALQFAGGNVARGGTILFATDASSQPGVDLGSLITSLRAQGISVNTILSGDCTGISSPAPPAGSSAGALTLARDCCSGNTSVSALTLAGGGDVTLSLDAYLPNELLPSGAQKPGDDDPPQPPIVDPGQDPVDEDGDTAAAATPIAVDGSNVRGSIGYTGDAADYFSFSLQAGKTYVVQFQLEGSIPASPTFSLLAANGTTVLQTRTLNSTLPAQFIVQPTTNAGYFLRVTRTPSTAGNAYVFQVREDRFILLTTAIQMFSTISFQTGGAFLVRDAVNTGSAAGITGYISAMFNVMASSLGAAVLAADPGTIQQGTTLTLNLSGRNTNWRSGSTVTFAGTGITVQSVQALSATSLNVLINIGAGATLGFRDVAVVTDLGDRVETAKGVSVVEVVARSTVPNILNVEPNTGSQGDNRLVLVRGVNTAWTAASTLSLGSGIVVNGRNVISPTLIEANISIPANAPISFYTTSVTTPGVSTQSKQRAFFVASQLLSVPEIASVTPSSGSRGGTLQLTVTGLNTHFVDGTTVASLGAGITVQSVSVTNPITAVLTVAISPTAAGGFRDVSVTTGGETAVRLQGFFVNVIVDSTPPTMTVTSLTLASGKTYTMSATDNLDPNPKVFVKDSASTFVAGPFSSGSKVLVQVVPTRPPSSTPLTGSMAARIQLNGTPLFYATDASGNSSTPQAAP